MLLNPITVLHQGMGSSVHLSRRLTPILRSQNHLPIGGDYGKTIALYAGDPAQQYTDDEFHFQVMFLWCP